MNLCTATGKRSISTGDGKTTPAEFNNEHYKIVHEHEPIMEETYMF